MNKLQLMIIASLVGFSLFASTMAWGQGQGQGQGQGKPAQCTGDQVQQGDGDCVDLPTDTSAATECTGNQVLDGSGNCVNLPTDTSAATVCTGLKVLNGTGNCVDLPTATTDTDTSAATECATGEVLVADGADGTCVPVSALPVDLRFESQCPCGGDAALTFDHPWKEDLPLVCGSNNIGVCDGTAGSICQFDIASDTDYVYAKLLDQPIAGFGRVTRCSVYTDSISVTSFSDLSQAEWDDCILDWVALADYFGETCPTPPVVTSLP